jgi:hypothetical protein
MLAAALAHGRANPAFLIRSRPRATKVNRINILSGFSILSWGSRLDEAAILIAIFVTANTSHRLKMA